MKEGLKKATTEMLILLMLRQKKMYAYEMIQAMAHLTNNVLTFNTLYIAIYRMRDNAYVIESDKVVTKDNRTRVYFSITETGVEYLENLKSEYLIVTNVINNIITLEDKLFKEDI